jgi:hypothetical protein
MKEKLAHSLNYDQFMCPSSIGSDTGGSVRNPASICGCLGYKPTYGLISRHGLIPLNNYLDTVGIMSQTIEVLVDVLSTSLFNIFHCLFYYWEYLKNKKKM